MPTTALERLMFAQAGSCFFCKKPLAKADASLEHLPASANGGSNADENCVACCKALNGLLGSMSLKEKIQVVLNQKGVFKCPNGKAKEKPSGTQAALIIEDLRRRGTARPKTVKALSGTILALLKDKISDKDLPLILKQLHASGLVIIEGTKVSYSLG